MIKKILLLTTLCTLILTGCSSTSMTNTWKSPDYSAGYINNVLVLCGEGNNASSRTYEDNFVAQLASMGIKATPGYQVMAPGQKPDEAFIRSLVAQNQYSFVLISKLKDTKTKTQIVPGAVYSPMSMGFYPYYASGPFAPSQTVQYTMGYLETKLFRVSDDAMIWAGESKAFDPHSSQSFVNDVTTTILGSMAQAGLLPPSK